MMTTLISLLVVGFLVKVHLDIVVRKPTRSFARTRVLVGVDQKKELVARELMRRWVVDHLSRLKALKGSHHHRLRSLVSPLPIHHLLVRVMVNLSRNLPLVLNPSAKNMNKK